MIAIALVVLVIAAVVLWFVSPGFRALVDGWKTRMMLLPAAIGVLVDQLDPGVVTTALGLGKQGAAWVVLGLLVAGMLFHEATLKKAKDK